MGVVGLWVSFLLVFTNHPIIELFAGDSDEKVGLFLVKTGRVFNQYFSITSLILEVLSWFLVWRVLQCSVLETPSRFWGCPPTWSVNLLHGGPVPFVEVRF